MGENIKTYLRIKPKDTVKTFTLKNNSVYIDDKTFVFDKVFNKSTQIEIFESISNDILISCMQGYNCTVFAYGQTGSGKTYTIQGKSHNPGLVQRSLAFLHNTNSSIELSFVEIYNENMYDLFDISKNLFLREDPLKGVVVDNLTITKSKKYETSIELYEKGIKTRKTSPTSMNIESSRSHSVFTIYIKNSTNALHKESRLCFVDLAGSERLKNLHLQDIQIKETGNINRSLFCLGKIIHKLSSGESEHIGYRDSKLTFLLKDSLGGNSMLRVIGNVSLENKNDSINTMSFLQRSKLIKNTPCLNTSINDDIDNLKEEVKRLDKENQELKAKMILFQQSNTFWHEKQMLSTKNDLILLSRHYKQFRKDFNELFDLNKEFLSFGYLEKKKMLADLAKAYKNITLELKEERSEKKRKLED